MLDTYVSEQLFEAVRREGLNLNDLDVQQKMNMKRVQIEQAVVGMVKQMTKHCGCGKTKEE